MSVHTHYSPDHSSRRRLRQTTCLTLIAGAAAMQPAAAHAQLLTLTGLSNDLNALTTTVTAQGTQLATTTNLANTLNTSVNTLTTTVANQASTLQTVQAATTANTADIATVTASVNQQQTQLTANTNLLNTATSGLTALGQTVATQTSALQGLQTTVTGNVADVAALTATVNQQGAQVNTNLGVLNTLGQTVATQTSALQGLQTTVTGNVADVAALTATVNQQGAQVNANLGVLNTLGSTVTAQGQVVQGLQGNVATLTGTLGTLAGDMTAATTQLAGQAADIGALRATVDAGVLDTAQLRATLGMATTDLSAIQTQVADHEVRITANTAQLGTLGATVALQGTTLTRQGTDLATAAANIASLQGMVTAHDTTLSGLGTTVAAQGTLLAQQDGRITANANAILSLRNMAVSGNASPVQYTTPGAPSVASSVATNDVAIFGAQAGPVRVHNVAAGQVVAASTDAVNGGQLYDVGQQVAGLAAAAVQYDDATRARLTLGGNTPVVVANVAAGRVAAGSGEAINGGQLADTNAAVAALGADVTQQGGAIAALRTDVAAGAIGPVRYSDPTSPTTPNGGRVTQSLTLVGRDPEPVALHNVAAGRLSSGSTDAVNGGQLFALSQSYQGLADLAVRYDDATQTAATLGAAGVPVGLRNVAAGTLAAGSTDAVNAGQLFDTDRNVATLHNLATLQSGLLGALDTRVDALDRGARGPVRYADAATPTTPNGGAASQDLTLVGAAAGPVRLHGVAGGTIAAGSSDAVNGEQFYAMGNAVASALGSSFRYDPVSGFTGNFTFGGRSYGNIQSVFGAIETSLTTTAGGSGGSTAPGGDRLKYFNANSTMADSQASGFDATAIGPASTSSGVAAIAVGRNAVAAGDSSVAIGDGAQATDGKAVSIGLGNIASGDGAVAIGDPNFATGAGATALGKDNSATGTGAIALGNVNVAEGDGSTAIGSLNRSSGLGAAALGFTNTASGKGAIAIGTNNAATGDGALAIGANVVTNAVDTLAIGNGAAASGVRAVAIGNQATATAINAASFGYGASAHGQFSTAMGTLADADGFGGTSLGTMSSASGYAASALGSGAIADKDGSVALGSASQTLRGAVDGYSAFGVDGPQRSLGEIAVARNIAYLDPVTNRYSPTGDRQITGIAAGSAATDAVNVAQLRGVSGTLGAAFVAGFGGGATYDGATGALTAPRYTLDGVTYSSVGDALQAINSRVGTGGGTNPVTGTPGGTPPVVSSETDAQIAVTTTRVAQVETRVSTVETRVGTLETRVTTVEGKADAALAAGNRAIRYDSDARDSVTLAGDTPVGLHNLAPGVADSDAVNVAQLNGAMKSAVDTANAYTDQRVAALSFDLGRVNRDVNAGVAGAMAIAGMPQPFEEGRSMFSLGAGTFQGQSAVAMGVSRIMTDGHTVIKLGATYNSRKRVGANAGIGYQF